MTEFEPKGGFPPIIKIDNDDIPKQSEELRGFATTNIVNISKILGSKKKENMFMTFDNDDDDDNAHKLYSEPYKFSSIKYRSEKNT